MSSDMLKLKELIKSKANNIITDSKAEKILSVLKKKYPTTSTESTLKSLDKYSELPGWLRDQLTINETFFFRHPQHFSTLSDYLQENHNPDRHWKILCCGVSSGEEAYSLAFICEKVLKDKFSITGVDLSQSAIEKAAKGVYEENLISRIPSEFKSLCLDNLEKIKTPTSITYKVKDSIKNYVRFKNGNIFNFPFGTYDIIFARNMLIYFDDNDEKLIVKKLFKHLAPNGVIFIGGGELFPNEATIGNKKISTSIIQKAG